MSKSVKKIGILTSGGDAPGMNAAIRAVVRAAIYYRKQPVGIYRGYNGLIEDDMEEMDARSVRNIIQRGGTILKSSRSMGFYTKEGRKKAFQNIQKQGIDALVTIGGDGTFKGAWTFYQEFGIPFIGIPGTIDNDIAGTDYTIGYDTACNQVIHAIDAIRDTASSHNRLFLMEVMGRNSGFLALRSAISAGVEMVLIPEKEISVDELMKELEKRHKKSSVLIVVAEGYKTGNAYSLAHAINKNFPKYDTKVSVLGHLQRGGSPSCLDREIASRMGVAAVEGFIMDKKAVMVGISSNQIGYIPFEELQELTKPVNLDLFRINEILSI